MHFTIVAGSALPWHVSVLTIRVKLVISDSLFGFKSGYRPDNLDQTIAYSGNWTKRPMAGLNTFC
jgi:hypothetical protein